MMEIWQLVGFGCKFFIDMFIYCLKRLLLVLIYDVSDFVDRLVDVQFLLCGVRILCLYYVMFIYLGFCQFVSIEIFGLKYRVKIIIYYYQGYISVYVMCCL